MLDLELKERKEFIRNEHKSIAYAMKSEQEQGRQKNAKILRALRSHERRLDRIEKFLKITPTDKELYAFANDEN